MQPKREGFVEKPPDPAPAPGSNIHCKAVYEDATYRIIEVSGYKKSLTHPAPYYVLHSFSDDSKLKTQVEDYFHTLKEAETFLFNL